MQRLTAEHAQLLVKHQKLNLAVAQLLEALECHPNNNGIMKASELSVSKGMGWEVSWHTLVCVTPPEAVNPLLDKLQELVGM
jgi:hypothetical protein